MKKSRYTIHPNLILAVISLILFNGCDLFDKKPENQVSRQLIEYLNTQLPGSEFKTDLGKSVAEPIDSNHYRITLKNSSFTTDLAWILNLFYKNVSMDDMPILSADSTRIEEMSVIYGPDDSYPDDSCPDNTYLKLQSLKGMKLGLDISEMRKNWSSRSEQFQIEKVQAEVGNIVFQDWDIVEMIRTANKKNQKNGKLTENEKSEPGSTRVEDIKLEIEGIEKNNGKLALHLEIDKILNIKQGIEDPYVNLYMFKKDAPPPDLRKTLQQGLAINDLNVEIGNIDIAIKKFGIPVAGGTIENVRYSQFMKPDDTRDFFSFGHGIDIDKVTFSMTGKKEIGLLGDIKELKYKFEGKHVTPELAMVILETIKKSIELRNEADNAAMQDITFQSIKFLTTIPQSKPLIEFSISPLKHHFGVLQAKAEIRLAKIFSPDVKVTVDISDVDKILKKIDDSDLLSPQDIIFLSEILDKYTIKNKTGKAEIIWELKSDQPGKYFLNGNPVTVKKNMLFPL